MTHVSSVPGPDSPPTSSFLHPSASLPPPHDQLCVYLSLLVFVALCISSACGFIHEILFEISGVGVDGR